MRRGISILLAIVIAGFVVYLIKQDARDARNKQAIERAMSGNPARPAAPPRPKLQLPTQ